MLSDDSVRGEERCFPYLASGYRAKARIFWLSLAQRGLAIGLALLVVLILVIAMWVIEGMW